MKAQQQNKGIELDKSTLFHLCKNTLEMSEFFSWFFKLWITWKLLYFWKWSWCIAPSSSSSFFYRSCPVCHTFELFVPLNCEFIKHCKKARWIPLYRWTAARSLVYRALLVPTSVREAKTKQNCDTNRCMIAWRLLFCSVVLMQTYVLLI